MDVSSVDEASTTVLLDLQSDILELVAWAVLANSPCDALCLCQACHLLRSKLHAVRDMAATRRLRWEPVLTVKHKINESGITLTVGAIFERTDPEPWAAGGLLPTIGRSSWKVRVENSKRNDGNGIWIGVCDAAVRISWGLLLYSGRLRRMCRDLSTGKLDFEAPPADDLPNGNYKLVMKDEDGKPFSLRSKANGAVIEVILCHDSGTLGFSVNAGPYLEALPLLDKSFPSGLPLRPYASCYYPGDSVSFTSAVLCSS